MLCTRSPNVACRRARHRRIPRCSYEITPDSLRPRPLQTPAAGPYPAFLSCHRRKHNRSMTGAFNNVWRLRTHRRHLLSPASAARTRMEACCGGRPPTVSGRQQARHAAFCGLQSGRPCAGDAPLTVCPLSAPHLSSDLLGQGWTFRLHWRRSWPRQSSPKLGHANSGTWLPPVAAGSCSPQVQTVDCVLFLSSAAEPSGLGAPSLITIKIALTGAC